MLILFWENTNIYHKIKLFKGTNKIAQVLSNNESVKKCFIIINKNIIKEIFFSFSVNLDIKRKLR